MSFFDNRKGDGNMYYKVHDFMIHDLELKGIDLNTFALIYSVKRYNGSLKTLCKNVGVNSINTVKSSLERLQKQGLITKHKPDNLFSTCTYIVSDSILNRFDYSIRKSVANDREWCSEDFDSEVRIGVTL